MYIQPKLTMSKVWFYLYDSLLKVKLFFQPTFQLLLPYLRSTLLLSV